MRVKTAQLIPNCILIEDIVGKSGRPLIPRNTTLSDQHILFLEKFLVRDVEVSSKLSDGSIFKPIEMDEEPSVASGTDDPINPPMAYNLSFKDHYLLVVKSYKEEFIKWKRQLTIDILAIRKIILPLLDRLEKAGIKPFFLHHHANREDYIFHHSVSVALLSSYIATRMGLSKKDAIQVGLAGLLSDSGLSKVDAMLIQNSIPLIEPTHEPLRHHPTYSYRLLESETTISQELKLAVLQHHERLDGSGYPLGLKSEKIHLYSRIIGVVDEYHTLSCQYLFKEKLSHSNVIEGLIEGQFTQLDPKVVQTVIQTIVSLAIGIKVILSNDEVGKIIFIDNKHPLYPMIQLEESERIVSLENERDLYIADLLLDW